MKLINPFTKESKLVTTGMTHFWTSLEDCPTSFDKIPDTLSHV